MTQTAAAETSRTTTALLLALAFGIALLFNGPGSNLILLAPMLAALWAAATSRLWRDVAQRNTPLPWGPVPALMATYVVWLFVSATWSSWPEISGYYAWILGALPLGFLLWLWLPRAEGGWERLWPLLLWLCGGAALWGVIEFIATGKRVLGPFLDFNAYGALFNVFFFAALMRYLTLEEGSPGSALRARGYEAFFLLALGALFATFSRGAIATWLVLLPPALWLAYRHGYLRPKRLLIVAVIAGIAFGFVHLFDRQVNLQRPVINLEQDASTQGRVLVWKAAWEIYKDHPWLGIGTATHKLHYAYYRDPKEVMTTGDLVHNDYLQFLEEGGPILLGFLLAIGLVTLILLLRTLSPPREGRNPTALQAAGLLLGVSAMFVHAVVNFIFYVAPLSLAAGLFLGEAYRRVGHLQTKTVPLPELKRSVIAFILVISTIPIVLITIEGVSAAIYLNQTQWGPAKAVLRDPKLNYQVATTLRLLRPNHSVTLNVTADIEAQNACHPDVGAQGTYWAGLARDDYLRLLDQQPANAFAFAGLGKLLDCRPELASTLPEGMPNTPEALLRLAIAYDPADPDNYSMLADYYEHQGRLEEAYALITQGAYPWFRIPIPNPERRNLLVRKAKELEGRLRARGSSSLPESAGTPQ